MQGNFRIILAQTFASVWICQKIKEIENIKKEKAT